MKISKTVTAGFFGLKNFVTHVEVDVQKGIFHFDIVGLGDKTIGEAKARVLSAIRNSGFKSPKTVHQRITVLLAPAHQKKEGSHFDLPIAISYLKAIDTLDADISNVAFIGELSLDGTLQPIRNILFLLSGLRERGIMRAVIPYENLEEAFLIDGVSVFGAKTLAETVSNLNDGVDCFVNSKSGESTQHTMQNAFAIDSIIGQRHIKRALEISLAGRHHIILCGSPGTGKTALANSARELLPPLDTEELILKRIIDSAENHAMAINHSDRLPPFRDPHHTSSYRSIIGNSKDIIGEIRQAHNGILFMDELAEFDRRTLESLRQPLEEAKRETSNDGRRIGVLNLKSKFILIGALNPCRCGYKGSVIKRCSCTAYELQRYGKRLSGPLLDRIDLWVNTVERDTVKNHGAAGGISGSGMKQNIQRVRLAQSERYAQGNFAQAEVLGKDIQKFLKESAEKFGLSKRAQKSLLEVSRTIADLEGSDRIKIEHLLEALSYRRRI